MQETLRPLFDMAAPRKARLIERREQIENDELVKQKRIKHRLRWFDVLRPRLSP
jgi:hypothetical protein